LLKPFYPTLLSPQPTVAFDQAVIGLIVYNREKEKRRERERERRLASIANFFDKELSAPHGLIHLATLTRELTEGLKNLSPDTASADPYLTPYLLLAEGAAEVREQLQRLTGAPSATTHGELDSLTAELEYLQSSVAKLIGGLQPERFIAMVEAADCHLSLKSKSTELKGRLDLEEIDISVGRMVGQQEMLDQFEVISDEGAGDILVVDTVVEKGYRLGRTGQIIKRPKVIMRRKPARASRAAPPTAQVRTQGSAPKSNKAAANPAASRTKTSAKRSDAVPDAVNIPPPEAAWIASSSAVAEAKPAFRLAWILAAAILALMITAAFVLLPYMRRGEQEATNANTKTQADGQSNSSTAGGTSPGTLVEQAVPDQSAKNQSELPQDANANINANINVAQLPGVVSVAANLKGVQVWLGDQSLYLSDSFQWRSLNLPPGQYMVRATKPGYRDWSNITVVRSGEKTQLMVSFYESQRTGRQSDGMDVSQTLSPRQLAVQHLRRGTMLSRQQDHAGAFAEAVAGLQLDPANASLLRLKNYSQSAMKPVSTPTPTPYNRSFETSGARPRLEATPIIVQQPATINPPPRSRVSQRASKIQDAKPVYPSIARAYRVTGTVKVDVTIDERGNVTSARAVSGNPFLRQAAEEAARKFKFRPALRDGQPTPDQTTLNFNFVM
jgi:TonB family protein